MNYFWIVYLLHNAVVSFISTRKKWPVCKRQERLLRVNNLINEQGVICIQKQFEKHRIGVIGYEGDSIGFVFADIHCNVCQLRDVIEQQLKLSLLLKSGYRFIERNGWPLTLSQEIALAVMDIISGCNVYVKSCDKLCVPPENSDDDALTPREKSNEPQAPVASSSENPGQASTRRPNPNRIESQTSILNLLRGSGRKHKPKDRSVKPVLISYTRAEAAQYALDLKKELVSMGFSVYLDVHEIKTGTDWQDDLNFAVTNCYLFVPLITPRYGQTQWTNREIKLADVLNKLIIPVNFMEKWPPECLAIQFAATQYIPWKAPGSNDLGEGETEKSSDPRIWESVHVRWVANQIAQCYAENYDKWPLKNKLTAPCISRSASVKVKDEPSSLTTQELATEGSKKLIVISAHPKQKHLASELKALFEKDGYHVWCSVDLHDSQDINLCFEEGNLTNSETPRELQPIPEEEGEVFSNPNDDEVLYSVGEYETGSTFNKDPETCGQGSLYRRISDLSDIAHCECVTQGKLRRLSVFQEKVDQAGVVIVLVSEAYTKSTFSQQQVFYCEHRKRVVLVKCDNSATPKWFRLLMGNSIIMRDNNPQFECVLKSTVKRALNPTTSETPKDATVEAKVNYLVNFLMRNLPLQDKCVYIVGSSKVQTQRAEEICRAIGRELAEMKNVSIVTGGFYGVADITAKTFCECKENNTQSSQEDSSVVHILPMHDSEDLSSKSRQNPDGSFEAVPYGKTVFLGDSVKERETVVARLLDTCIVIEGGPGVVHEVEEFIWNDHFVIPIISTGGAAGGNYGVPVKIFELPPGVGKADWSVLSDKDASPEKVAKAVVNIMIDLKKALSSTSTTNVKPSFFTHRSWKKSKSIKRVFQGNSTAAKESGDTSTPSSTFQRADTMRDHLGSLGSPECQRYRRQSPKTVGRKKWWRMIFETFEFSK